MKHSWHGSWCGFEHINVGGEKFDCWQIEAEASNVLIISEKCAFTSASHLGGSVFFVVHDAIFMV